MLARRRRNGSARSGRSRDAHIGAAVAVAFPLTLVLGGARSGKSRFAEGLLAREAPPWSYVATAEALDAEMVARIAAHRARRPGAWQTLEAPHDLARLLTSIERGAVLVDCLTLWLSNRMLAEADVGAEITQLEDILVKRRNPLVLVSNEVGLGVVPDNALARAFRDRQGELNQRVALQADRVVLMVAGLPLFVKGSAP